MIWLGLILMATPLWADDWQTELVSQGLYGDVGNAGSSASALSSQDGRYSVFGSASTNLVAGQEDSNNAPDVFLFDRVTQTTTLVSRALGSATATANGQSNPTAISADGNWVLYWSNATNVVVGATDGNGQTDVFLFDRGSGTSALVSRALGSVTVTANNSSLPTAISADGNWVLYYSNATNVVAGVTDGNSGGPDVFLFDRSSGTSTLVSRALGSATVTANGQSVSTAISADGNWAIFRSTATDVVPGVTDSNGQQDVFLYDRSSGTSSLVSRALGLATATANNVSTPTAISADGNWVLYQSSATNVVSGVTDGNGGITDVFLFDRNSGTSTLVSRALGSATATANNTSTSTAISADGNWVLYYSAASNNIAGVTDSNGVEDVFLFDRSSGSSTLVSRALGSAIAMANNGGIPVAISADGNWVLYRSNSTNVIAGVIDSNGATDDVFLFDRGSGTSTLVSRALGSATTTPNGQSVPTAISADGNWVLYFSSATNVVAGVTDGNGTLSDVFLFDRSSGGSTLVSRALSSATAMANGLSTASAISADGNWVLYYSTATNVVAGVTDSNGQSDVFLFDRSSGSSTLVSRALGLATATANGHSVPTAISADGNWVLYYSSATNVVAGVTDSNGQQDVFLYDRSSGTSTLVSRALGSATTTANNVSTPTAISADGNWVLYFSSATNVVAGVTDSNGQQDVFLYDRSSGTSTLVSRALSSATAAANGQSFPTAISADGNWVLYRSNANNVVMGVTDSNGAIDVFLFDRSSGTSTLVSRALGSANVTANSSSFATSISTDGNWVLYYSSATNVVAGVTDSNGQQDVFLYDRSSGTTTLVSRALGSATATANGQSNPTAISADGNWVLYWSNATNVVAGATDGNGQTDVFLFDRSSGTSTLVSRALGSSTATANGQSNPTAISADGATVLFQSNASNIRGDILDLNNNTDVFVAQHRFTVTPIAGAGGDISPSIAFGVNANATTSLTVTPDAGYSVQNVTGCGGIWSGANPYTTAPIDTDCTVTATFKINQYTLTYTADANGSISGDSPQTVSHGANGTPVEAIPNDGYHFDQWSDGSTDNPRTELNVAGNLSFTAAFANEAPSIAPVTDRTVLEDSGTGTVTLSVSDLESAASTLVVSAASSNTGIVPHPTVNAGLVDGERVLSFAPADQQNGGPVTITLTVTDPAGGSAQRAFAISVTPVNDRPTLSLGSVTPHAAGTNGVQTITDFASVQFGPADEQGSQGVDDYLVANVDDPDGVVTAIDIANSGTLSYTLSGVGGTATISASVRDNGGTADGGVDTSLAQQFTIVVAPGADLQIGKTNQRSGVLAGESVLYAIVVANAGPNAVTDASVIDLLPNTLSNGAWQCVQAVSTATCPSPSANNGNLDTAASLGVNQFLRFDVIATVSGTVGQTVINTVSVAPPAGVTDLNSSNDSATDSDPVVPEIVFGDGFESAGSGLTVPGAAEALR